MSMNVVKNNLRQFSDDGDLTVTEFLATILDAQQTENAITRGESRVLARFADYVEHQTVIDPAVPLLANAVNSQLKRTQYLSPYLWKSNDLFDSFSILNQGTAENSKPPVYLSKAGQLVIDYHDEGPKTLLEASEAMLRFILFFERNDKNAFLSALSDTPEIKTKQAQTIFENLKSYLEIVPAQEGELSGLFKLDLGLDHIGRKNLRARTIAVLRELMWSLDNQGEQGQIKSQIEQYYFNLATQETEPMLLKSMTIQMYHLKEKGNLSAGGNVLAQKLADTVFPASPSYQEFQKKWDKRGQNIIRIHHTVGAGEFLKGTKNLLAHDYQFTFKEITETELKNDPVIGKFSGYYEKKEQVNGEEYIIQYYVTEDHFSGSDKVFEGVGIADPTITGEPVPFFDIHSRDGHSNWTKYLYGAFPNGTIKDVEGYDNSIFMLGQCWGKAAVDILHRNLPGSHIITTQESSYFRVDDQHQMIYSENLQMMQDLVGGIIHKKDYTSIRKDIIQHDEWTYLHRQSKLGCNYILPNDLYTIAKTLSVTERGIAATLDEFVGWSYERSAEAREDELIPKIPERSIEELNGVKVKRAVDMANVVCGFSGVMQAVNPNGRLRCAGWKDPEHFIFGDTVEIAHFHPEFTANADNGSSRELTFYVELNSAFSHVSEEILRAIVILEFARFIHQVKKNNGICTAEDGSTIDLGLNSYTWNLGDIQNKLEMLILVSQSLHVDSSYNDAIVFESIKKFYGFPSTTDLRYIDRKREAQSAIDHDYSGSYATITSIMNDETPSVKTWLAELNEAYIKPQISTDTPPLNTLVA